MASLSILVFAFAASTMSAQEDPAPLVAAPPAAAVETPPAGDAPNTPNEAPAPELVPHAQAEAASPGEKAAPAASQASVPGGAVAATAAVVAGFVLVDVVALLLASIPVAALLVLQVAVIQLQALLPVGARQVETQLSPLALAVSGARQWAELSALLAPLLGVGVGLLAVPAAAVAGRRIPWFAPWLLAALLPAGGFVVGLLGAAALGVVSALVSVGRVAVTSNVAVPANLSNTLFLGAYVTFAALYVAMMCGSVLAGQVLAAGAMALVVKVYSRERAEGEPLFHTDVFRLSPTESQEPAPASKR